MDYPQKRCKQLIRYPQKRCNLCFAFIVERTYLGDLYSLERRPLTKSPYGLGRQASWKKLSYRRTICQKHYPGRYLRIDCSDDAAFTQTVIKNSRLSDVLQYIELRYGFLVDANHLLIFDEAQEWLPVVKMMKHVSDQRQDIPSSLPVSCLASKFHGDPAAREEKTTFLSFARWGKSTSRNSTLLLYRRSFSTPTDRPELGQCNFGWFVL